MCRQFHDGCVFALCLCAVFEQNAGTDKSVFPLPEPQDVFLAAQVRFDDLERDLRQFGRDLSSTSCPNSLISNWLVFKLQRSKNRSLWNPHSSGS